MNINKHIKRLVFTVSKGNKPNSNDIEALNSVIEWVNNQRKITIENNTLYAKLYMYVFADLVKKYEADFFDDLVQKELHKLLDTDLNVFYTEITNLINEINLHLLFKSKGFSSKHPILLTDLEKEQQKNIINNLSEKDIEEIKESDWKYEDVKSNLDLLITESFNRFSHV